MKTVDYYMELPYRMEIIPDKEEGGFIATFPKSLHKQLAEHSKSEGVSMNQYCVYLLSMNSALRKGVSEGPKSRDVVELTNK